VKPLDVGLVLLFTAAGLAAAWLARDVLLLGFLGVIIAVVLSFPVAWLSKVMSRGLALLMVLLVITVGVATAVVRAAPLLMEQAEYVRTTAPRSLQKARQWLREKQGQDDAAKTEEQAKEAAGKAAAGAIKAVVGFGSGVTIIILVIALGAFLVHEPDTYRKGLRRLVPPRHREKFDESWKRVADALRRWLGGIIVSMTLMGALTALGLAAAGVKGWLLLGLLTFFGTFVPYVGAIASAIPGLLVALAQSPHHLGLAFLVYVGVHIVEGYIVEPLVMKRAVEIKPALMLAFQATAGAVFGVMGTVVATPLLVCVQELVQYHWVERHTSPPGGK
jgi:predicted PurR-regulated permease PerM